MAGKEAKEATMMQMYRANLRALRAEGWECVSAGRLAKHMGVTRLTAKKYLQMNVRAGYLIAYDFIHVNGANATAYIAKGWVK